jgi:hypothetical protein
MAEAVMSIILFPSVVEVVEAESADEISLDDFVSEQQEIIDRWRDLGFEFKQRVYGIAFDIYLEIIAFLCKYLE